MDVLMRMEQKDNKKEEVVFLQRNAGGLVASLCIW